MNYLETDDRFDDVKRWFDALCDLPVQEQSSRLAKATLDESLRAEVQRLLQLDQQQGESPPRSTPRWIDDALQAMATPELQPLTTGQRIGPWKLVGVLGVGGMGTVFRAQRVEGQFEQAAAIKVLTGARGERANALLGHERHALASLSHPNIARILDAGLAPDGQPFLAMDCIDGQRIDTYAAEHLAKLAPQQQLHQTLGIFRTLCEAIDHAHQRLLLHCDIKPSNILVTPDARPMLLDFGIAQALRDGAAIVESRELAFTPQYASPEQMRGEALTTASDVYSLGLVFQTVLKVLNLPTSVLAECDAMVVKATHQSIQARYANVAALEADLHRLQAAMPISALPQSFSYLATKLWQRRKGALLVGAAASAAVLSFSVLLVVQRDRAVKAEALAVAGLTRATKAEQVATTERDRAMAATQLAEKSAQQAQAAFSQSEQDRQLALKATEAEKRSALEATRASRRAQHEATLALEAKARAQSAATLAESARAQSQLDAETARMAEAAARSDRQSTEAVRDFLLSVFDGMKSAPLGPRRMTAYELLEKSRIELQARSAGDLRTRSDLLRALASIYDGVGGLDNMKELWLQVASLERHPQHGRPLELALALSRIGLAESNAANHRAAEPYAREALALRRMHLGEETLQVADSHSTLGLVLSGLRQHAESREHLEASLRIRRKLLPANDSAIASALHNLGQHHAIAGTHAEGVRLYDEAIAIKAQIFGQDHPSTLNSIEGKGMTLWRANRLGEAEPLLAQLQATQLRVNGPESERFASAATAWGNVLVDLGQYEKAKAVLGNAVAVLSKPPLLQRSMRYAISASAYAAVLMARGEVSQALAQLEDAYAVRSKHLRPDDPSLAGPRLTLGRTHLAAGNLNTAAKWIEQGWAQRQQQSQASEAASAEAALLLAELRLAQGRLAEAEQLLSQLRMPPQANTELRMQHSWVQAQASRAKGENTSARQALEQRAAWAEAYHGPAHPRSTEAWMDVALLMRDAGDRRAAVQKSNQILGRLHPFAPDGTKVTQINAMLDPTFLRLESR